MNSVLFYHTTPFLPHHLGVLLDEAVISHNRGDVVCFAVCDGLMDMCFCNPNKNPNLCKVCKQMTRKAVKKLPKSIKVIKLLKYKKYIENKKYVFDYSSVSDIKRIEYKGCKIGYSTLSAYITKTRNCSPKINTEFKFYFDSLLTQACALTDVLDVLYGEVSPSMVCLFNGRFYEHRPFFDLAVQKGINAKIFEVVGGYGEPYHKVCFDNITPHNIKGYHDKVDRLWQDKQNDLDLKISVGRSFFENRRKGRPACDVVYTANQEMGCLPVDWNANKTNIVIFNSSEDEFASVGDEYEKLAFFRSQIEGIKTILSLTKEEKNIHYYLRIHPNLSKIKYRYHTDLLSLGKTYDNVTVIPGTDKVSTYELMDKSDKIVVFGSTMGLEAAYWGKPVILLSGSFYYYTDLCYKPHSKDELYTMLTTTLASKNNEEAVKFGFNFMYRNPDNKFKHVDFNWRNFEFLGRKLVAVNYLKLLGSARLYAVYIALLRKVLGANEEFVKIPMEEGVN